jgi:predicted nucleic acid-binding protein
VERYVLDTNLYIRADRDVSWAEDMDRFVRDRLPSIFLHAVVAQELLAGAIDLRRERLIQESLIEPFERRRRVITPTFSSWKRAGRIIAQLAQRKLISPGGFKRSFVNDCLLAASCREHGIVLITENKEDIDLIQRVERIHFHTPWPE